MAPVIQNISLGAKSLNVVAENIEESYPIGLYLRMFSSAFEAVGNVPHEDIAQLT